MCVCAFAAASDAVTKTVYSTTATKRLFMQAEDFAISPSSKMSTMLERVVVEVAGVVATAFVVASVI